MKPINGPGDFGARPVKWSWSPSKTSDALGLWLLFSCDTEYPPNVPTPIPISPEQECEGTFWVYRKDGSPSPDQYRRIMDVLGWDGTFEGALPESGWLPNRCRISVEADTYKNQTRYRAAWVNPADGSRYATEPTLSADEQDELAGRFSERMKANAAAIRGGKPLPKQEVPPAPSPGVPPDLSQVVPNTLRDVWTAFAPPAGECPF